MKIKIIAVFIAMIVIAAAVYIDLSARPKPVVIVQDDVEAAMQMDGVTPPFSFTTLEGKSFDFSDLNEEIVLIHFWAGWCGVCFKEFPDMLKRVENSNGKLALLAIAIDDDLPLIERFINNLRKKGTKTDVDHVYWVWDEGQKISLNIFNTIRVPETIIVDKNRNMVRKIVGPADWTEEGLPFITPP